MQTFIIHCLGQITRAKIHPRDAATTPNPTTEMITNPAIHESFILTLQEEEESN
jgi:hypothetical protein